MSANVFLSNFKNNNVVKTAAIVPKIPWVNLSNLSGNKDLKKEKEIKSPVNVAQNKIAFTKCFVLMLFWLISFIEYMSLLKLPLTVGLGDGRGFFDVQPEPKPIEKLKLKI